MRDEGSTVPTTQQPIASAHTSHADACPNCGRAGMEPFYRSDNVPAHSCLLMSSRQQSLDYPRGHIVLGFCDGCGFVSNTAFDPALNDYSPQYEETQHFSPRFNQFAQGLVDRLVKDYDLRNKDVLEVGCGKGEFLAMLCERGENRGIGIDPGCRPERHSHAQSSRITWIRDLYSERYSHLQADLVCCRHTLEHIHPTRDFVQMIRRSIGDRLETLVFFEVPDVVRVLREQAFWDIYYEHCSYFSPGSLARLFRDCRFDVLELVRDYDDQYLWLMARPTEAPTTAKLELEDDLDQLRIDVDRFREEQAARVRMWKQKLGEAQRRGQRPVVWGSGSKCVALFATLGGAPEIELVVDINPYKHGKFIPGTGHPIVAPEFLRDYCPRLVVAMNPIYVDEIGKDLERLGVKAEVIAV